MRVHKFGLETPMELDEIEDAWAGEGEVNFAERCLELTGGRGVDIVIEMIAEENLDRDVDAIYPLERIVVEGTSKGQGVIPFALFNCPPLVSSAP